MPRFVGRPQKILPKPAVNVYGGQNIVDATGRRVSPCRVNVENKSSEDRHAAWDAFWSNEPGPDGVELQDHFARAWQHVAARFRNMPGVIGYDR